MTFDPVQLEISKHQFAALAEEMGAVLQKSSYSPNIKERRDFSCALFDAHGRMVSQAAHIPVHLGSMPLSVQEALRHFLGWGSPPDLRGPDDPAQAGELHPGDVVIMNDPYRGGTHLPDITLVQPVFAAGPGSPPQIIGLVANRAHHADVGGMTPGSMGLAREIYQEGLVIPPIRLVKQGQLNLDLWNLILANVRTPQERAGDLQAQLAANLRGAQGLLEIVARYGVDAVQDSMQALIAYSERMTRRLLADLPDGRYQFRDFLDDGVSGDTPIPIEVEITIRGDEATVDFSGSASQQPVGVNAVYAITFSAVYYAFRCLMSLDIPNNSGCLAPIQVIAPPGSVVNASHPAPVVGGNVETAQRIVDVLFGALAQAAPGKVPAASQGTMNNLTIGGWDRERGRAFTYYETIGGGMGARPTGDGPDGVHSHMTNTLNTPAEALEYSYPLRVERYEIRRGSGGRGRYRGGDGIRRDLRVLTEAQVSLLAERRRRSPYGLAGGSPGKPGRDLLLKKGVEQEVPSKGSLDVQAGDVISIRTPGGGGYGEA